MLKKSRSISLISSMLIGVVFMLAVMALLAFTGVISIGKTELTFKTSSVDVLYDGRAHTSHKWELTRGELKDGHQLEVVFAASQTSVGETDNAIEVKITDELGTDVTGDYNISYDLGKIKVDPRSLVITSDSASKVYDGEPLFAPTYKVSEECDGVASGHRLAVLVRGFLVTPGTVNNIIESVNVYDEHQNDVTGNYRLLIREGTLTVKSKDIPDVPIKTDVPTPPDFGDSGSNLIPDEELEKMVLFSVLNEKSGLVYLKSQSFGNYTGKDWLDATEYRGVIPAISCTASYLPSFAFESAGNPRLSMQIKSYYDLYVLPYYPSIDTDNMQKNDVYYTGNTSGIYTVKYYDYSPDVEPFSATLLSSYERQYRDFVYKMYCSIDSYTLSYMKTVIAKEKFSASDPDIINKVADYIKNAATYNLDYNAALDDEENVAIAFLDEYKEGVCKHYASAATLLFRALGIPARYTVGVAANTQAGEWVNVTADKAHAWVEVYIDGIGWRYVEVTGTPSDSGSGSSSDFSGKPVVLKPKTVRKLYDGRALYAVNELDNFSAYDALGYSYEVTVSGSRTEPGITKSEIVSIIIRDATGKDITDSLNFVISTGSVQIYKDVLSFESNSYSGVYDGEPIPLKVSASKQLGVGYEIVYSSTASNGAGRYLNTFTVRIHDANGEDVTDNFWIKRTFGEINVEPLPLTLKAGDGVWTYTGSAYSAPDIIIVSGDLLEGHAIKLYTVEGSQTEIGRSDNIITHVMICDKNGMDVTANYSIEFQAGRLEVLLK